MKTIFSKYFFSKILALLIGMTPLATFSPCYGQEYQSADSVFNESNKDRFLWLGGAAAVGGIAGYCAGQSSKRHGHSSKQHSSSDSSFSSSGIPGPQGPQGVAGPIGPVGPQGPAGPGFTTEAGALLLGFTLAPIPVESGSMELFLIGPDGVTTSLATLALPLATVTSIGPFQIPNPTDGTYTIVIVVSSDTLGFPTVTSLGKATVAYTLGTEVQVFTLAGIGSGILAFDTQVVQSFGFNLAIFNP